MNEYEDDIRRYRDGSMTGSERNALEKKALDDPFLSDALEGVETISAKELSTDLEKLSSRIQSRQQVKFIPLRIAAGIAIVLTVGSIFYYFNFKESDTDALATQELKSPSFADSISATGPDSSSAMLALSKEAPLKEPIGSPVQQPKPALAFTTPLDTSVSTAVDVQDEAQTVSPLKTENETAERIAATPVQKSVQVPAVAAEESKSAGASSRKDAAMKRSETSPTGESKTVVGNVTASDDGIQLPGANITIKGTSTGTVTDIHGNYSLMVPANGSISFSYSGLKTKEVDLQGRSTVNVQLEEDVLQVSEVVFLGVASRTDARDDLAKRISQFAGPAGGIEAFNKYIESNLRYPQQALDSKVRGKVTITFAVTTTGALADFRVEDGLGFGCDEEAIRLIKEGPAWTPSMVDVLPVKSGVRVKVKFNAAKANK